MNLQTTITTILALFGIFGAIYTFLKLISSPNTKQDKIIAKIENQVKNNLKCINNINNTLNNIQNNHLKHIQETLEKQGKAIVQLSTIINERIPRIK